jgi:hypothetical protein
VPNGGRLRRTCHPYQFLTHRPVVGAGAGGSSQRSPVLVPKPPGASVFSGPPIPSFPRRLPGPQGPPDGTDCSPRAVPGPPIRG